MQIEKTFPFIYSTHSGITKLIQNKKAFQSQIEKTYSFLNGK
ncbi:hypothetical protein [Flavobacterium sp.]